MFRNNELSRWHDIIRKNVKHLKIDIDGKQWKYVVWQHFVFNDLK